MPIIRMNYLDLPSELRQNAAKKAKMQLQASLGDPTLTPDQVAGIRSRLSKLIAWEQGTLNKVAQQDSIEIANLKAKVLAKIQKKEM